jgi:predicted membrane channel-forming protein YqfA (hemolysin III family)
LFAGGVAYSAGVLLFINQRLRCNHFVWHLFEPESSHASFSSHHQDSR